MAPDIISSDNNIQRERRAGAFFLNVFFFYINEAGLCKIPVDFTVGPSAQTGSCAHQLTLIQDKRRA